MFAAAGLGEEGLEGSAFVQILAFRIGAAISLEAMLKEVPGTFVSVRRRSTCSASAADIQLPSAVTKLRASLADVEVADLDSTMLERYTKDSYSVKQEAQDASRPQSSTSRRYDSAEAASLDTFAIKRGKGKWRGCGLRKALSCNRQKNLKITYLSSHDGWFVLYQTDWRAVASKFLVKGR
jgi:hypothetical protein